MGFLTRNLDFEFLNGAHAKTPFSVTSNILFSRISHISECKGVTKQSKIILINLKQLLNFFIGKHCKIQFCDFWTWFVLSMISIDYFMKIIVRLGSIHEKRWINSHSQSWIEIGSIPIPNHELKFWL